jgi:hypothetical protein
MTNEEMNIGLRKIALKTIQIVGWSSNGKHMTEFNEQTLGPPGGGL